MMERLPAQKQAGLKSKVTELFAGTNWEEAEAIDMDFVLRLAASSARG